MSHESSWQAIYQFFVEEVDEETMEQKPSECGTPKNRQKDQKSVVPQALDTPPRPDPPPESKRLKFQKVGNATKVPFARVQSPASPTLCSKGQKPKNKFDEKEGDDAEEAYHRSKMAKPDATQYHLDSDEEASSCKNLDDLTEKDLGQTSKRRKRARHTRVIKKAKVTEEVRRHKLDQFLASEGVTYSQFLEFHQGVGYKKSRVCFDGGYKDLKLKLLAGQAPSCEYCVRLFSTYGLTVSGILERLASFQPDEEATKDTEQEAVPEVRCCLGGMHELYGNA